MSRPDLAPVAAFGNEWRVSGVVHGRAVHRGNAAVYYSLEGGVCEEVVGGENARQPDYLRPSFERFSCWSGRPRLKSNRRIGFVSAVPVWRALRP